MTIDLCKILIIFLEEAFFSVNEIYLIPCPTLTYITNLELIHCWTEYITLHIAIVAAKKSQFVCGLGFRVVKTKIMARIKCTYESVPHEKNNPTNVVKLYHRMKFNLYRTPISQMGTSGLTLDFDCSLYFKYYLIPTQSVDDNHGL